MSHVCPANTCTAEVDDDKLLCRGHWAMVPAPLQRAVYAAWDHGNGGGSLAHMAAMAAALHACNARLAGRVT